jgi:hypothetical protein
MIVQGEPAINGTSSSNISFVNLIASKTYPKVSCARQNNYSLRLESNRIGKRTKICFINTSIPMACGIKISENKIAASGAILRIG